MRSADVTGVVLAGGASRRFGADKALAMLGGRPLVAHVADALAPLCAEVLVATGPTPRAYPVAARIVVDRVPDGGPLAGLDAAFAASTTDRLLVAAADLPFVTTAALGRLLHAAGPAWDAVVAVDAAGRRHPVCALYHRRAAEVVARRLEAGTLALHGLLDALAVGEVRLPEGALRNVNRPADLAD